MSNQSFSRINTLELKALIVKRIGHQRADMYFNQLTRLFSSKTTKSDFNKLCIKIIGRENVPLHNRLIKSILKNACTARLAPPKRIRRVETNLNCKTPKSCVQSLNGDALNKDRKLSDRPSPLGPLGKPQSMMTCEQQSATELLSLGSRPVEIASEEDGEEVEQSRGPVTAPFGVSMNLGGGSRKTISHVSISGGHYRETCLNDGFLPDTRLLRNRLERKLESEGVRVSVDCINLLNNALDMYLKRLIEPCVGLASSRRRSNHLRKGNGEFVRDSCVASMLDFHAAMELNPRLIGEDWPTILEKISLRGCEE